MYDDRTLYILWTNADIHTSMHMVMMYATNSMLRGWWDNVKVIIWGATTKLVSENDLVQEKMKMAMQAGVEFTACIACAGIFGVADTLKDLGIEVIPWGKPLTDIIQGNGKLLSI